MSSLRAGMLVVLLAQAGVAGAAVSCHIHPPGSTPQRPVGTIGPFASATVCEQARFERFGDLGRCHCAADFSPRWLPPADPPMPADALSG
jgi:hypothetical protein